jgi:hypothetical protein
LAGYFLLSEVAQPLIAPVSPPTMRRWNMVKNTNAGIIDNEVNPSTFAVSTRPPLAWADADRDSHASLGSCLHHALEDLH